MKVKLSTAKTGRYIPKWNGNENDTRPIEVVYNVPSIELKEKLLDRKFDLEQRGADMVQKMSVQIDRKRTINAFLERIENLEIEDDNGNVKSISNTKELFASGLELDGLVEELYAHFTEVLNNTEVNEKNSE